MENGPISPKWHIILDYAFVGGLLILPTVLNMNKKAKAIYAAEAMLLIPYLALTKQPGSSRGLIPFELHRKVDPINIAQFALLSVFKPIHKTKKELIFNIAFTAFAGLSVLLTDWDSKNS